MYLIAGLGNPGRKYVSTRHNTGFEVLDALCSKHDIALSREKCNGIYGKGVICGEDVLAVKPQTYMNLSGECIRGLRDFYRIPDEQILIIFDDISLPTGKIRFREKGSAGGHNGMKNIIYQLGTEEIHRIKIGIGMPEHPGMDPKDYVLGKFTKAEVELLIPAAVKACGAVEEWISHGAKSAMNLYNG